jgi:hypothetical protein
VHYFGASLGGILGSTFMAYEPEITRGVLGVPGSAWSLLFERSFAWTALQGAIIGSYEDQYYYQMVAALLGLGMEPYDSITTAGGLTGLVGDGIEGVPDKQILMYEGIGDCLVTNMGTEMLARTMGLQVTAPSLKVPYGIAEMASDQPSGFTIYDESPTPLPPTTNIPPSVDNGTHGDVNERPANLRQIERFFLEGVVGNECALEAAAAPCDCATGACE